MNMTLNLKRVSASAILLAVSLSVPAFAQHHGAPRGAPAYHGAPQGRTVYHGGGYHTYNNAGVWWGLGLGLGLGWAGGYYGYPYYGYYYPPVVEYTAPTAVIVPSNPPAPPVWYYCDSLKDYYPTVERCPEQWRVIPATPPVTAPAPAPARQ